MEGKRDEVIKSSAEIEKLMKQVGYVREQSHGEGKRRVIEDELLKKYWDSWEFFEELFGRLCNERKRETLEATGKTRLTLVYSRYYWAVKCRDRIREGYYYDGGFFEHLDGELLPSIEWTVSDEETDRWDEGLDWGLLEAIDNGTYQ